MGTWTLWIAFNAGVVLALLLDLGLLHRHARAISLREAALQSAAWVALSVGFGLWILASYGHEPSLQFFTGYLIEKSLSVDNVFVFLLIFQYFRVHPRYQYRLLFWGVLGALVMRGALIGAGVVLIRRFEWVLYLFGASLVYAGLKLFRTDHSVHPEKNLLVHWVQKVLPVSQLGAGARLFVREAGRWLATPLLLVIIVVETTDLVFAVDSIPAVFGVTRDPFLVYTSNVCAILGLRALYFLLARILPNFHYLDEGLAVVLMFVGAKMLAEPWVHVSTELSLILVGSIIGVAMLVSVLTAKRYAGALERRETSRGMEGEATSQPIAELIDRLADPDPQRRAQAASQLSALGRALISPRLDEWLSDQDFERLLTPQERGPGGGTPAPVPRLTTGIAVRRETFAAIRKATGMPRLAEIPPDQEILEFELHFADRGKPLALLDILTTAAPGAGGAIARFLEKFGEGIQQVEIDVSDVDRATEILRGRFHIEPVYPATRAGANGTRVNFFLVPSRGDRKVLVELVEQPKARA